MANGSFSATFFVLPQEEANKANNVKNMSLFMDYRFFNYTSPFSDAFIKAYASSEFGVFVFAIGTVITTKIEKCCYLTKTELLLMLE